MLSTELLIIILQQTNKTIPDPLVDTLDLSGYCLLLDQKSIFQLRVIPFMEEEFNGTTFINRT